MHWLDMMLGYNVSKAIKKWRGKSKASAESTVLDAPATSSAHTSLLILVSNTAKKILSEWEMDVAWKSDRNLQWFAEYAACSNTIRPENDMNLLMNLLALISASSIRNCKFLKQSFGVYKVYSIAAVKRRFLAVRQFKSTTHRRVKSGVASRNIHLTHFNVGTGSRLPAPYLIFIPVPVYNIRIKTWQLSIISWTLSQICGWLLTSI